MSYTNSTVRESKVLVIHRLLVKCFVCLCIKSLSMLTCRSHEHPKVAIFLAMHGYDKDYDAPHTVVCVYIDLSSLDYAVAEPIPQRT